MRGTGVAMLLVAVLAAQAHADEVMLKTPPPLPVQQRTPRLKPPPPPRPVVAPEIEAAGRAAAGNWTCTGSSRVDAKVWAKLAMTFTTTLDLDNAWIKTSVVDRIEGKPDVKLLQYLTYDAVAQEWTKIELDSTGARSIETATRPADGVWVWQGMRFNGDGTQNTTQVRSHDQSDQTTSSAWAEELIDGKWTKVNESTCKRAGA